MTIDIKTVRYQDFLKVLSGWQAEIIEAYLDEPDPYVPQYRKAWESSYDPKYIKGTGAGQPRRTPPDVNTLPEKRWVAPRYPTDPEEALQFSQDMKAWIAERKVKCQECEVLIGGRAVVVYLFKKQRDALLFKLTWG